MLDWSSDPVLVVVLLWLMLTSTSPFWFGFAVLWMPWLVWDFHRLATRGQSWGKGLMGIKLVDATTLSVIGYRRAFVRWLAHLLDSLALYTGWFWPMIDPHGRTFADMLCGTHVVDVRS